MFMVYVEGGQAPAKKYIEVGDANAEAQRLCQKEGKRVYVMESIRYCEPPAVVWQTEPTREG